MKKVYVLLINETADYERNASVEVFADEDDAKDAMKNAFQEIVNEFDAGKEGSIWDDVEYSSAARYAIVAEYGNWTKNCWRAQILEKEVQ